MERCESPCRGPVAKGSCRQRLRARSAQDARPSALPVSARVLRLRHHHASRADRPHTTREPVCTLRGVPSFRLTSAFHGSLVALTHAEHTPPTADDFAQAVGAVDRLDPCAGTRLARAAGEQTPLPYRFSPPHASTAAPAPMSCGARGPPFCAFPHTPFSCMIYITMVCARAPRHYGAWLPAEP